MQIKSVDVSNYSTAKKQNASPSFAALKIAMPKEDFTDSLLLTIKASQDSHYNNLSHAAQLVDYVKKALADVTDAVISHDPERGYPFLKITKGGHTNQINDCVDFRSLVSLDGKSRRANGVAIENMFSDKARIEEFDKIETESIKLAQAIPEETMLTMERAKRLWRNVNSSLVHCVNEIGRFAKEIKTSDVVLKPPFEISRYKQNAKTMLCIHSENKQMSGFAVCTDAIDGAKDIGIDIIEKYYKAHPDKFKTINALKLEHIEGGGNGSGRELVKEAVRLSEDLGYEGRVYCFASPLSEMAKDTPIPFYNKLGFKAVNQGIQKQIEAGMESFQKTGVYNGPDSANMYLPTDKIAELLV